MENPAPITLDDVAAVAGVSVATASRALAGRGELSRATRERVADAAEALGYVRRRSRRGRPTTLDPRLIELVLGSFDDSWTNAVAAGVREAAFRLGYDLVLTLERADPDVDWPTRVATRRPFGAILGLIKPTAQQLEELGSLRIPVVLLEPRAEPGDRLPSVGVSNHRGGYEAGIHLADGGYERFVVLTARPPLLFGRARERGFRDAIAERRPGAEILRVHSTWSDAAVTPELLRALSRDREGSVGVFACDDEMALSVYRAVHQLGRAIPEEVGVVGFNDEPRASIVRPQLTTVRQPVKEMTARAVELLTAAHDHGAPPYSRIDIATELMVRESTLRPRTARDETAPAEPPG